jgi:membrane-associated phospholipid phosphatase
MGTITLLYGETILITQGLTQIIKSTALRPRPYVFDENLPATTVLESNDRAAFLSGHTSISAAAAFFTARVFADYFPDSKAKPYVWGGAAAVPALMGYLRVRAGRHYPSDVIAGYALGALVGYAVPALHRKPRAKNWVRVSAGTTGLYLSYRW